MKNDKKLTIFILSISTIAIGTIIFTVCKYRKTFNGGLSSNHQNWGEFGSLVGGISAAATVLISVIGTIFLVQTLRMTSRIAAREMLIQETHRTIDNLKKIESSTSDEENKNIDSIILAINDGKKKISANIREETIKKIQKIYSFFMNFCFLIHTSEVPKKEKESYMTRLTIEMDEKLLLLVIAYHYFIKNDEQATPLDTVKHQRYEQLLFSLANTKILTSRYGEKYENLTTYITERENHYNK